MNRVKYLIIIIILFMFFSLGNLYLYDINLFNKQLIWYLIGFSLLLINFKRVDIKFIFLLYLILNVLLLYLLLFGDSINGSKAWLNIFGFSIQPSEFMKVVLIILLSYISVTNNKYIFKCILITLIPSVLTFLEPDTGNVIFYLIILFSAIFKRINLFRFSYIFIILICIFLYLYYFNIDILIKVFGSDLFYRLDRFTNFNSYQLDMALIGISNSGLNGIGEFILVPEVCTDFMFTLNIMNFGFIGLVLYLIINLVFNLLLINISNNSIGFYREVINNFLIVKLVQEGIHIGMNVGLAPITGITLPFISYGGSSLLSLFLIISYINSMGKDSSYIEVA